MSHLSPERAQRAKDLVALYPQPRSALIPLCHLAQEQDGWLRPESIEEIAQLLGITAAEVRGTASFYDMLRTEPVGRFLVSICTNIACLLGGAEELLEHAERSLGVRAGGTTADGMITLEDAECLAGCDRTPCVTVNHRYVGGLSAGAFDRLVEDLRAGRRDAEIPPHGTLVRVRRNAGLRVPRDRVAAERRAMAEAQAARAEAAKGEGA
ncbi:MAG: NAD(P)H-dependent oxidoreductase subunit E [Actinomycetota bacterium]|nr:NAD(P)H-dependent oxidoreductase subunit E [Actinomycetota bacterium]